ncbi:MAG: hypothetical protein M3033_05800 [Acidobacteriota bacterium]|nr:hypothetical protein [Acidobacteriota bacterium]
MFRAIALSLFLLIGLAVVIPFVTDYAEAGAHKHHKHKHKHRKYKKYSKKWWRQYHLRQKRRRALAARRQALRLRQIRLENAKKSVEAADKNAVSMLKGQQKPAVETVAPAAVLPSGEAAPKGWKRGMTSPSELQFNVNDDSGSMVGSASISVVGPAMNADNLVGQNKTVGGVPTSSLRRTVIDRMIREEGWVVNDYQKEIGGKRVFVVVAQSPGTAGRIQSRLFYFTEVDGRIYSVATNAPSSNSQRIEQESEKVVVSLQRRGGAPQQAELK